MNEWYQTEQEEWNRLADIWNNILSDDEMEREHGDINVHVEKVF